MNWNRRLFWLWLIASAFWVLGCLWFLDYSCLLGAYPWCVDPLWSSSGEVLVKTFGVPLAVLGIGSGLRRFGHMTASQREGSIYLAAFIACIPAANWMIGNVGTTCLPDGPCLVPVAPGLMAPSGVLAIGLALVLRDLVQRRLGRSWALAAVAVGAVLSGLIVPASLALASAAAFLLSELADFAVYTPLQERRFLLAVFASSIVGLCVDSVLFVWLAFGNLDFLWGQIVGKLWMVLAATVLIYWIRARDRSAILR